MDAILNGERDPLRLAQLRQARVKASDQTLRKALVGNWRSEHLFTLRQSRELYQSYQQQIVACDGEIERLLGGFAPRVDPRVEPLPPDRQRNRRKGPRKSTGAPQPGFDVRTESYKLFGVDVTQIPGIDRIAFPLFGEIGRDMSRWPTAAHFCSWSGLCPDNDISGGKVLWKGVRRVKNRAGQLFRLAAYALHSSSTPMGDYLRRMKAKLGPAPATTATAHKIAVLFYTMVKKQVEYDESLWAQQDTKRLQRREAKLKRDAKLLGYQLIPGEPKPMNP